VSMMVCFGRGAGSVNAISLSGLLIADVTPTSICARGLRLVPEHRPRHEG
jgi:hypothetical protein